LYREDGLLAIARAAQTDDDAVAHELVFTYTFDGRNVFDPDAVCS
jgi:hypothetical protein